jgi:hypothetical protein
VRISEQLRHLLRGIGKHDGERLLAVCRQPVRLVGGEPQLIVDDAVCRYEPA